MPVAWCFIPTTNFTFLIINTLSAFVISVPISSVLLTKTVVSLLTFVITFISAKASTFVKLAISSYHTPHYTWGAPGSQ